MVITGNDSVVSAIRIIDRFNHIAQGPDPPDKMPPGAFEFTFVVSLVSGPVHGRHRITIAMQNPAAELTTLFEQDHLFGGDNQAVTMILPMNVTFTQEGLHWLVVSFENEPVTRTPLEVVYQRIRTGGTPPTQ